MTNINATYKAALAAIKAGSYDVDATLVAAVENNDASGLSSFESALQLDTTVSLEGFDETVGSHKFKAAVKAAASINSDRSKLYEGLDIASTESGYGVDLTASEFSSLEHFDGKAVDKFQAATFTYNVEAATQDAFSEAFFPTVIGDVSTAGIKVSLRTTQVISDFLRTDTKSDAKKFNRRSLISALSDQDGILAGDHLKLVPVVDSGFDEILLPDLAKNVKYDAANETVSTAPFVLGKTLNVIGAAQSAVMLAKGVMDNTDTLDSSVPLENLHFATSEDEAHISVPVSHLDGAVFLGGQRGDSKDLVLSAKTQLVINLTTATVQEGKEIPGIDALPAGSKAVFDITILGNGNAVDGELLVTVPDFIFVGARDANGDEIVAGTAAYDAIEVEALALKAVGVDFDAKLTNSNIRRNGIHLTSKPTSDILPVRAMTPIYTDAPISGQNINDNDGAFITDLLAVAGILSNFSAVRTLTGFATFMKSQVGVNPSEVKTGTIGQTTINPFYKETVMVLEDYVDSNRSHHRQDDVRASVINNIAVDVAEMLSVSGYNNYNSFVKRAPKIDIVIGTYPALAAYLGDSIDLGNNCIAKIVATDNTEMNGRLFVTIGDTAADTNEVAIDRFGSRLFVPSLVSSADVSENGSTKNKMVVNPLFNHIITCPVLLDYKVTGLSSVLMKVTANRRTI